MVEYPEFVCNTLAEVETATSNLDIAKVVPLKIDDGGVIKDVNNYKGIYNISQGKFCTAVVPHYNLVQHKQYVDGFAEALKRLGMEYTMEIKQSGNKMIRDVEFLNKNIKFDKLNEEFTTGIRLINSYDKTTGLYVIPKYKRLACSNGMIVTRCEKSLSIKHHSKMVSEIQGFIEKKIGEIINSSNELQLWVSTSMKDTAEWKICCSIIEKLFQQIKHRTEILKRLNIGVIELKDKKTKKKSVSYVWNDKSQKKTRFTRWEIYNAVTSYLSHGEQITPHIENIFHRQAEKLLITPLNKMLKAEVVL